MSNQVANSLITFVFVISAPLIAMRLSPFPHSAERRITGRHQVDRRPDTHPKESQTLIPTPTVFTMLMDRQAFQNIIERIEQSWNSPTNIPLMISTSASSACVADT
jgi:hypothetical protein